ncbi:MAG: thioredoxin domain-containing protein [Deltaproteobacteria bacterium]|nr:thioredoxin domain-containing protein [Deltaproteobacteria bacterium]
MPRALILVLLRMLVLVSTAVSSALLYDYKGAAPAFCVTGDGCAKIKESAFASIAGVSTPVLGVLAFGTLFGLTLLSHKYRRQWMVPVAILGALSAAAFIAIQAFVEHTFCKLCMVVDTSAIAAGGVAVWYWLKADRGDDGAVPTVWWSVMGAVAIAAPQAFGRMQPLPEVKPAILKYWQPDKINIVEMSDFECPFCRMQHPALLEAAKPFEDRIHFVRLTVPLAGHPFARPASRAYLCARDLGKGEAMAHELFTNELTPGTLEQNAAKLAAQGMNLEQYKACLADPKTDARVTDEYKQAHDGIGFKGLPTTWIGGQLFEGAQTTEDLRAAIQREATGGKGLRASVSPIWLWSLLIAAFLGVSVAAVRQGAKGSKSASS